MGTFSLLRIVPAVSPSDLSACPLQSDDCHQEKRWKARGQSSSSVGLGNSKTDCVPALPLMIKMTLVSLAPAMKCGTGMMMVCKTFWLLHTVNV